MKIAGIQLLNGKNDVKFGSSTRVLKNTVSQLSRNNSYSLSEPNQRRITNSITELGKLQGNKIIDFLLNTAAKLKYSTNIKLKDNPVNNWKEMLLGAVASILASSTTEDKESINKRIEKLNSDGALNGIEKEILKYREQLLKAVDIKQIERETVGGIKDFERNLDYFIISSETTQEHKKYVLKRLNYLMSPKYEINPQLKDKKSVVAAELINDMAIFTPGHKVPNIKAVNQKQHGMCAAISIVRKKIAYEDKPNYIDSILSELDATDYICVYDRSKLGSGEKTYIRKIPVDFDAALAKGYRIIDASSTQWMEIANRSGYSKNTYNNYTSFDKENFDINADSFYNTQFQDPELKDLQAYYQALVKISHIIGDYKAEEIKSSVAKTAQKNEFKKNSKAINSIIRKLGESLEKLYPESSKVEIRNLINGLTSLEKKYSHEILQDDKYSYIANEEEASKKNKIKSFLIDKSSTTIDNLQDTELNKIYGLIESFNILEGSLYFKHDTHGISRARELYQIGAGTRYQFLKGLENEATLNYMMKKEHIPNAEECIENTVNTLINKLQSNSPDSNIICEAISNELDIDTVTPEACIKILEQIKTKATKDLNKEIDSVYHSLGLNNRTDALAEYIENLQVYIGRYKDTGYISTLSENMGVKNSALNVMDGLERLKNKLINNECSYNEVFNIVGSSSQILFLRDRFQDFVSDLTGENAAEILENFITNNNLNLENLQEEINAKLSEITGKINRIYNLSDKYIQLLRIPDNNGNLLYTPDPAELLIKTLENNNTIPSEKVLQELQAHLDRIQKDRSTDEFNSRQGKLHNKALYKFTEQEKQTLDAIERNITPLHRYIKKQLSYVQQYIRVPLEELKRMIGVDMGDWWVREEGHSGLSDGESVRILEYITGRPHYSTENLQKAIAKIKTTPYSGISSSSVFHNEVGMHAQYIADIAPVEIKHGDSTTVTEDVLFQDNSWGASEHENTWVDSSGLTRTDYSDNRGGTLGYITNGKYRNGNLIHRVMADMVVEEEPEVINSHQYKRIKKERIDTYRAPQYSTIILDGKAPESKDIATSIYDTIFTPTSRLISTIRDLTKNMTESEIEARLNKIKSYKNNWQSISENLLKRIQDKRSSAAIKTQEDYDRLPDTDYLKIVLEKAALLNNLYIEGLSHNIGSVNELEKFRTLQKERAIENFKYSFGKNIDILDFLYNQLNGVFGDLEIDEKDFDGSISHTIDKLIKDLNKTAKSRINNSGKEVDELTVLIKKIFAKQVYFNKSDIDKPEIQHIIRFIDRVYNPADDNELVKIYQNLQNMTTKEFEAKIVPLLTNEDLNIKNETGFSLLKRIQHYEESAEDAICNVIYIDELDKNTERSKYNVEYTNNKLSRVPKYLAKYNFDTAYREMKNDLFMLTYPKRFSRYKDANLSRYGAFPAYPKVEYMPESLFDSIIEVFIDPITENMSKIKTMNDLLEYYETSDKLKEFANNIKKTAVLTDEQYFELNSLLGKIYTLSYNDDSQEEVNNAAGNALELEQGHTIRKYMKYIKTITDSIDSYIKVAPKDSIEQEINNYKEFIAKQSEILTNTYIRTRYQHRFAETLQKYKKSMIKNKKDVAGESLTDDYKEQLINELKEYNILQEPEEVLDRYIKSLSKESPLHDESKAIEALLKRALEFARLCDIQRIIMGALKDGIETDIKSSFKNISVPLQNGATTSLDNEDLISYIVHNLVYDSQEDTALLFLDKLGLNETYVKHIANDFDYEEIKNIITESVKKLKQYHEFTATFNKHYAVTRTEIENGGNATKSINRLRKVISEAAKATSIDPKYAKLFLSAIETCKAAWKENPDIEAVDILSQVFYTAGKDFEDAVNSHLNSTNDLLESHQNIIHLVNNVPLDKDTEANKLREKLNNKFAKLVELNNTLLSDLPRQE